MWRGHENHNQNFLKHHFERFENSDILSSNILIDPFVSLGIIHLVCAQNFPKNWNFIRTCTYEGVRNVTFSKSFAYVLNEWSLTFLQKFLIKFLNILYDLRKYQVTRSRPTVFLSNAYKFHESIENFSPEQAYILFLP